MLVAVCALGIVPSVFLLAVPRRARSVVAGGTTAILGVAGVALGVQCVRSGLAPVRLSWLLPLSGAQVAGDALSGLFTIVTGAVAIAAGIFAVGYGRDGHLHDSALAVLPPFVASMLLVPLAGSVTTFLAAWELMALSSTVLVLTDHHRASCRRAGLMYLVMTHLGFLAVLVGMATFASTANSESFALMARHSTALSPGTRDAVFLLTIAGFASKAGLLPLHAWLPRAHPEAPGPVSALMSAAMVNLGVYGVIRLDVVMMGSGPQWWGLTVLALGAVTAVYAALQASVATDLKRLLAYSTCETTGLIAIGVGTSMVLETSGHRDAAAIAVTAALLHVLTHAAFKTLAFLGAATVHQATGTVDLDELGGLSGTMPATTAAFGIAALAGSGLPLGAAFVSEWLLLQSLVHAVPSTTTAVALVTPLALASVALCSGLGVAALVKAFGVGFLARPRSDASARAADPPAAMIAGMAVAVAACALLAVAPAVTGPMFTRLGQTPFARFNADVNWGTVVRLPGSSSSMSPMWIATSLVVLAALATAGVRLSGRRQPASTAVPLWACGAGPLSSRMQYTATSFAEPMQRVFDDVLRPDTDIEVSHLAESRYLLDQVRDRRRIVDVFEARLYDPVTRLVTRAADAVRRAHNGRLHLYLAYGAAGLLIALVIAA
jgi:formate hydrogenlyase subunit 3/multisubunit Na+/H+ antiporter MnhD subunit